MEKTIAVLYLMFMCSHGGEWNYAHHADDWSADNPTCDGARQSPVDIHTSQALPYVSPAFILRDYDFPVEMEVTNNGHSLAASLLPGSHTPSVTGGGLEDEYKLDGFHFHWGLKDKVGSEHRLDGESFSLEMHMVHYNNKYGSVSDAMVHEDGLVVLSVLFEADSNSSSLGSEQTESHNENIEAVLSAIKDILPASDIDYSDKLTRKEHDLAQQHTMEEVLKSCELVKSPGINAKLSRPITLRHLLPWDANEFYRYAGSLTTPPCSESVTWILFAEIDAVPTELLLQLRSLEDLHHSALNDNFRPVQPLHHRPVHHRLSWHTDWAYVLAPSWAELFPTCGGSHQSPIDLEIEDAQVLQDLSSIEWYKSASSLGATNESRKKRDVTSEKAVMVNNGRYLEIDFASSSPFLLSDSATNEEYRLQHLEFHWGSHNLQGSEHSIEGLHYSLELQVMHLKKPYKNLKETFSDPNGVIVISQLFQVADESTDAATPESVNVLQELLSGINEVVEEGQTHQIPEPDVNRLVDSSNGWWEYEGSLNTPPCSENVLWRVMNKVLTVSQVQLEELRKLKTSAGQSLSDNFRPIQPRSSRQLVLSFISDDLKNPNSKEMCVPGDLNLSLNGWKTCSIFPGHSLLAQQSANHLMEFMASTLLIQNLQDQDGPRAEESANELPRTSVHPKVAPVKIITTESPVGDVQEKTKPPTKKVSQELTTPPIPQETEISSYSEPKAEENKIDSPLNENENQNLGEARQADLEEHPEVDFVQVDNSKASEKEEDCCGGNLISPLLTLLLFLSSLHLIDFLNT